MTESGKRDPRPQARRASSGSCNIPDHWRSPHSSLPGEVVSGDDYSPERKGARVTDDQSAATPASCRAATRRSRRPTATPRCRRTSRPCPAGSRPSAAASTCSSPAPSPACGKRCGGTRRSTASRARAGSSLPLHHEVRQGDVLPRHVVDARPAGRVEGEDVRYFHIHESEWSTRNWWRTGSGRRRSCPAGFRR